MKPNGPPKLLGSYGLFYLIQTHTLKILFHIGLLTLAPFLYVLIQSVIWPGPVYCHTISTVDDGVDYSCPDSKSPPLTDWASILIGKPLLKSLILKCWYCTCIAFVGIFWLYLLLVSLWITHFGKIFSNCDSNLQVQNICFFWHVFDFVFIYSGYCTKFFTVLFQFKGVVNVLKRICVSLRTAWRLCSRNN